MKSRILTGLLVFCGLGVVGAGLGGWVEPISRSRQSIHSSPLPGVVSRKTVQGLSWGMLGGFRTLAADLAWLRGYHAWEMRDAVATEAMLWLATSLDGRVLPFWLNGARMIAYDFPAWQIQEAGGSHGLSLQQQSTIGEVHARRAIAFLAEGMADHPANAALWVERANIELHRLKDPGAAAASYRRAAELPGAPYYAARLYAELLRRLGQKAEALAWLTGLYPTLPPQLEAAGASVVLQRIRQLETELSIPAEKSFLRITPLGTPDRTLTGLDSTL